jgi:hypothetical protein
MELSIFEKASRAKLRFTTPVGHITSEDLWDLPLLSTSSSACLDDIARDIYKRVRDDAENVSFVTPPAAKGTSEDRLRLEIVKRIIEVKIEERDKAQQAEMLKAKKQRILAIMAEKEDESLKGASLDELKQMLSEI